MNTEELTIWIKNCEKLDILHTYCTDITLVRKVVTKQITIDVYQKQLIANYQSDIDKFITSMKENETIVTALNDTSKTQKYQYNITTCKTAITTLEKELAEIKNI